MLKKVSSIRRIIATINPRPELQSAVCTLIGVHQPRLKTPRIFRRIMIPPLSPVEKGGAVKEGTKENGYHAVFGKIKSVYTSCLRDEGKKVDLYL